MTRKLTSLLLLAGLVAACGDEMAPEEDHTPATAKLYIGLNEITPAVGLTQGQTVRIEVRFYAADGDLITGLEDHHFAALTFAPGTLATVVSVTSMPFFFDVTAQASAGTGTVTVGYGHEIDADELSFGPFIVTIQ